MQIYNEQISDLITGETNTGTSVKNLKARASLKIREDKESGIFVEGLKQIVRFFQ